jgi:carbon-monoxide dehydrogenase medium subunit
MKPFQYHEPETVKDACDLLSEFGREAAILAGGTDLVVQMKKGAVVLKQVINIKKIKGLDSIDEDGNGYRLGALSRLSDISAHPGLRERLPILCNSAGSIGSAQVRNLATVGGNLCNGSPSADMAPGLLVLDAAVSIEGPAGKRSVPLEAFFLGPGSVDLEEGEMLTEVYIPFPPEGTKQLYLKHGPRRAMDIAVVGVAVALCLDDQKGRCETAKIALGAVAPTPVRARKTEKLIEGKAIHEIPMNMITEALQQEMAPISDIRASAEYRYEIASVLTVRAIKTLLNHE